MPNYKNDIYKKYETLHTDHLYGKQNLNDFRRQFVIWDKYYGQFLPEDKNVNILDVGCGNGGVVYWLSQKGYKNSSGVDASPERVESAKSLGVKNVELADLRKYLSKSYGKFDVIFILDVLEHFAKQDTVEILGKINNALTPEGVVIIKTANAEGFFSNRIQSADLTHETAFTESSLRAALSLTGFYDVICKEAGPVIHGIKSFIRFILWKLIRKIEQSFLVVETGSSSQIMTQNIISVARKIEADFD